ncbi:hypothetical protein [Mesorhizobium amorphae]|uniref:hypothetical protein n=1 Tax=Mesorhizobium amorphae TaxID=71433 RepID=UPI0028CB9A25|nr:hypothetical protein [Mesorhizobium amorphae]
MPRTSRNRIDNLEVAALEHTSRSRGRPLLQLSRDGIGAHRHLVALDHMPREPLREEKLTVILTRIDEADRSRTPAIRLKLHWKHQMLVAEPELDDLARDVLFMQSLHDDDDRRTLRIVQTGWHRFPEHADRRCPVRFAFRCFRRMRIVDDDTITAATSERCKRLALAKPSLAVLETDFGGSRQCQGPKCLIPVGRDQISHTPAVTLDVTL